MSEYLALVSSCISTACSWYLYLGIIVSFSLPRLALKRKVNSLKCLPLEIIEEKLHVICIDKPKKSGGSLWHVTNYMDSVGNL